MGDDVPPVAAGHGHALGRIVGNDHVIVDADLRRTYEVDWTGRWSGTCQLVVRPGDTHETSEVLAYCTEHDIAVVPQGGNTGLVGGGVPRRDRRPVVVLSTKRLATIGAVDAEAQQVTCGAGVTIAAWRDAARVHGLDAPVDFAARDSATIGGAIATNAGGSRVLRYGTMRQQVAGIDAVLADGRRIGSLSGLTKETVGIHWPSVIAGSEGTLAIVTAARLRLVPAFASVTTALVSMATLDDALTLLGALRRDVSSLDATELILPEAMAVVVEQIGAPPPVEPAGAFVMVECADHRDPTDDLIAVLARTPGLVDSALASSTSARETLVRYRDRITDSIATAARDSGHPVFKLDVAVPVRSLPQLLEVARRAAADTTTRLVAFGHLAEGNLHLNYLDVADGAPIADAVLQEVARLGGTISAEHGVGIAKTPWMHLVRSADEIAAQAAIRNALDPRRILNPGVLDPTWSVAD